MSAQRLQFHQSPFTVFRVQAESHPYKHRSADDTEADTYPLVDACHVHDDKQDEEGEQSAGEDEQVLAFQPLELRAAADSLVDRILRRYWLFSPLNSGLRPIPLLIGYSAIIRGRMSVRL